MVFYQNNEKHKKKRTENKERRAEEIKKIIKYNLFIQRKRVEQCRRAGEASRESSRGKIQEDTWKIELSGEVVK